MDELINRVDHTPAEIDKIIEFMRADLARVEGGGKPLRVNVPKQKMPASVMQTFKVGPAASPTTTGKLRRI